MIQNTTTKTSNVFSLFPEYSLEQALVVPKKSEIKEQVPAKDVVEIKTDDKKISNKKKILFGSTLASTILTAGVVSLILVKGVHGASFKNKISQLSVKLSQDIHDVGQSKAKDIPSKVVYHSKKGVKKSLDVLQASSNFTTFKDYGSSAIFKKTKPTSKFVDKTTSMFKKIVDKTLGKKYSKVEVSVKDLTSLLKECDIKSLKALDAKQQAQKITIKGQTKTLAQWIEQLDIQNQRLSNAFDENFSAGARKLRDKKRTRMLADLPEKIHQRFFKDKKSLLNLENYKTYATEDLAKPAQEELRREIINARKEVSNNINSISQNVKTSLGTFFDSVKPTDSSTKNSVQTLRKQLETFKKCSGSNEVNARNVISKEITATLDDILKSISSNNLYDETEQKMMNQLIEDIRKNIVSSSNGNNSKGALEEIMTILKGLNGAKIKGSADKVVSDSDFKNFAKLSQKISKGMKEATDLEMGEYFLKQAELKVGSAPTDVLSVIFPIGVGAYSIAKTDDKDERISATLTTCIPLIGTFATFVYGTVKMLSGAKNLIFSGISGLMLSQLGNYADKLYKKYKNTGSVVNVVKDEANNFWTGLEPQIKQFDDVKKDKK